MKALHYYGQRDIRIEDIPVPELKDNQLLIRVTDVGLCQTQVNEFVEGPFIINTDEHPRTKKKSPFVVGHEYGGVIKELGDKVKDKTLLNKQVAVLPLSPCNECDYCKRGRLNCCEALVYYGLVGEHGGLAEYSVVNEENVYPVEDASLLTFIEPLLCGINCGLKLKQLESTDKILVLGVGAIGVAVASVLKNYFKLDVVVNDQLENRLETARKAGFKTLDKTALCPEYDVVIDVAGSDTTSVETAFIEGFDYLKKGGTLVSIGTYFHPVSIVPCNLTFNEFNVLSSFSYTKECIDILPKVLDTLDTDFSLFIEEVAFENVIEEGYYRAEVDRDSFTRLVIKI